MTLNISGRCLCGSVSFECSSAIQTLAVSDRISKH